jgi:predicted branched-subunit amino acid permease
MGMFSAWRNGHVNQKTFSWVLAGAILFILSDCVLALNLFSIKPQQSSDMAKYLAILNMALYLTGQFMITVGAIYQIQPTNSK